MKTLVVLLLLLTSYGVNAQKHLTGFNHVEYYVNGNISGIDSFEFLYNSPAGSILENGPEFKFIPEYGMYDWIYQLPLIKCDAYNRFYGNSLPLTSSVNVNQTIVDDTLTLAEFDAVRYEFFYHASGNISNIKRYSYDGSTFVLYSELINEFDSNNHKTVASELQYYPGGITETWLLDSFFFDTTNNLVRHIRFENDWNGGLLATSQSLMSYIGNDISIIERYYGDEVTPLTWTTHFEYDYWAGTLEGWTSYEVNNGTIQGDPFVETHYQYATNNRVSSINSVSTSFAGSLYWDDSFSYDAEGFITESTKYFGTSSNGFSLVDEKRFYYDQFANLDEYEPLQLTISPNPSSEFVEISIDSEIKEVAVFSLNGAIMILQESGDIDISNLPSGVYVAKVRTSTGTAQGRFVKL